MIIGVDIDDTLTSEHDFVIHYGTMYCNKLGKYNLKRIDTVNITEMFDWPLKIAHEFYYKYSEKISEQPAVPFASEVLKKLKKEGHQIYIITARKQNDEWFPKHISSRLELFTAEWLLKNEIPFDKIFFDAKDKGKVCRDNGVDIMIDDDPENIEGMIGNTSVFIYDKDYNRKPEYSLLTRVYSWYDAYKKIKLLESKRSGRIN